MSGPTQLVLDGRNKRHNRWPFGRLALLLARHSPLRGCSSLAPRQPPKWPAASVAYFCHQAPALPWSRLLCVGAVALVLAGCAGYHLGPTNGATVGARSVEIRPFTNKTLEPGLGDYAMNSLRKNLMRDGTYRIDTGGNGDLIMTGAILSYQRHELSLQPTDVLTVLDYEITITAQITVRERLTGKLILDRPVKGRTSLRAGADLTSAERQAIPLLTDDLAQKATALLVDGTW